MVPKISIIVAVYKAEPYIRRCINSILDQTFTDFELLLIDDGSPDRSGEICEEYAKQDRRIRVFHKENGGVSSSRQLGIEKAQGEYSIHADPDDWIEPDMLENMYAEAIKNNADMVICDFYRDKANQTIYVSQEVTADVIKELFQQLHGSCWNKLVKQVCYNKFKVSFPVGLDYCEDFITNMRLLVHDINVVYLPKAFYHYVENYTSITRTRSTKKWMEEDRLLVQYVEQTLYQKGYDEYIINLKLNLKWIHLRDKYITNKEYMDFLPEVIPYIFKSSDTFMHKVLLWLGAKGYIKSLINFLLRVKSTIKQVIKTL